MNESPAMPTKSTKKMTFKEIKELLALVQDLGYAEFEFETEDVSISVRTAEAIAAENASLQTVSAPVQMAPTQAAPAPSAAAPEPAAPQDAGADQTSEDTADDADTVAFNAPMVGTFYRRPSPDKDVFIKVGDDVKDGDPVCIIEAMKLFNEVAYEGPAGKVVKVLVDDATPVEYDQPLFLVEPVQ